MSDEQPIGKMEPWWEEPSSSTSNFWGRVAWIAAFGISLAIFELTSNSSVAIAAGCLGFAWRDFATARNIRRGDNDAARAWVCAWFYRAWGLLKVSLIAITLLGILLASGTLLGRLRNQEFAVQLRTAGWLALIGFGSSLVCTRLGSGLALSKNIKVWVGGRKNRVKFLIFSNLATGSIMVSVILWFMIPMILTKLGVSEVKVFVWRWFGVLSPMIGFYVCWKIAEDRVFARTKAECWPIPIDFGPKWDKKGDRYLST